MSFINTVDVIGDNALTDSIIERTITEIADNMVTEVGNNAFSSCTKLATANFPVATNVGNEAFNYCTALVTINFPALARIGESAFAGCNKLTRADFPMVTNIIRSALTRCSKLTALILRSETMATLDNKNAFTSTPIASGTGYIYVPRALLDSYKAATNWSTYANQFRALEDYTVDGTITGELDPNKI